MIQCNNCGQGNMPESNFCRFCGLRLQSVSSFVPQPRNSGSNGDNYDFAPAPRPHIWKTDELQISSGQSRGTENNPRPVANLNVANFPQNQDLVRRQAQPMTFGYRCPRCASQLLPKIERKVSAAGWVTFAVLMVMFFPLFWVGLLIKEEYRVCPVCKLKSP